MLFLEFSADCSLGWAKFFNPSYYTNIWWEMLFSIRIHSKIHSKTMIYFTSIFKSFNLIKKLLHFHTTLYSYVVAMMSLKDMVSITSVLSKSSKTGKAKLSSLRLLSEGPPSKTNSVAGSGGQVVITDGVLVLVRVDRDQAGFLEKRSCLKGRNLKLLKSNILKARTSVSCLIARNSLQSGKLPKIQTRSKEFGNKVALSDNHKTRSFNGNSLK